ncbi:succinate dehydrogenase, hydrophobic membrane anchor protein [Minwuia sp.]|uniref:succinate dehydrogenase, hydrophobic membrane anchor protein n=1 Tax=Minwuia sp. TaxID=2493630 RepID=UPI003A8ED5F0
MKFSQLNTPLKNVRGLGSAKDGTEHWWMQRVTAIALVPLVFAFAVLIIRLTGADYNTAAGIVGNPIVTGVLVLLIVTVFWHLKLGMQVVIEDYVHGSASKLFLMFANTFGCWIGGLICVLAVLKIAFGG